MAAVQHYVQWIEAKKCWRFRRRVPDEIRDLIGQREWVGTLAARTRTEAQRLAIPHIAETNRIIELARAGNWPPVDDDEIEILARGWWKWFEGEPVKRWIARCGGREPMDRADWALAGQDDLTRSLRRFLTGPRIWHLNPTPVQGKAEAFLADPDRVTLLLGNSEAMMRLKRQCRVLHHHMLGGFLGEIEERDAAMSKVADALNAGELDPRQLATTLGERQVVSDAAPMHFQPPPAPAPACEQKSVPAAECSFKDLIDSWAAERKHIREKSVYEVEHIAAKLAKFLGHEERLIPARLSATQARELTRERFLAWKASLIASRLSVGTIRKNLNMTKKIFDRGAANSKIEHDPTAGITYEAKRDPRKKRLGYGDDDAQKILLAARQRQEPCLRWIPWVCALTGCRLDEVASTAARDIEKIGRIYTLAIRLENRDPETGLKTESSARVVPLHPALVADGFVDYWADLPKDGPLFPDIRPDRFGRRAGTATKQIGEWVRNTIGITDPRLAPSHAWRHRFISEAREAGIDTETRGAITGHSDRSASREYGDFYVRTVLYPAIRKIVSPLDKKMADEDV
jgi:integrase